MFNNLKIIILSCSLSRQLDEITSLLKLLFLWKKHVRHLIKTMLND